MHAIEEINSLSAKMDELMYLVASINAPLDPIDMPLSSLIVSSNASLDVNFVGRNNFGNNNAFRGNYVPRPFPSNSLITLATPTTILMEITIDYPLI